MKANRLIDDFNDGYIEPKKWGTAVSGGGFTSVEGGGIVTLTVAPSTVGYARIFSIRSDMDMTSSFMQAELTKSNGTTVDSAMKFFANYPTNTNVLYVVLSGSNITAVKVVAGVSENVLQTTYNATDMAYLRMRESAGIWYWDYSSDGYTWINLTSLSPIPFAIDRGQIMFECSEYAIDAAATSMTVDDFNVGQNFIVPKNNIRPAFFTPGRAR